MSWPVDDNSIDLRARAHEFYELCKPRVVMLIVFTAVVGMLLASPGLPPWHALLFGTLGIAMQAGAAAAINQIIDQQIDARMQRTRMRPLVTGRLSALEASLFAIMLGTGGFMLLWLGVNPLTAVLTLVALVGYAGVYTVWLKHATPQNIVIGGAAGAAPPVLGWAAVTGDVNAHAMLLFMIIFIWTPPHFWALAIERRDDYAKANVPMLPVTHGIEYTKTQILIYALALTVVSLMPVAIGMSGWLYLLCALPLNAVFVGYAVRMKWFPQPGLQMRAFGYSIVYLAGIFSALLVDHYLLR